MEKKPKSAYKTFLKAFADGLREEFYDENGNFEEALFNKFMQELANDEYMLQLAAEDQKRGALSPKEVRLFFDNPN